MIFAEGQRLYPTLLMLLQECLLAQAVLAVLVLHLAHEQRSLDTAEATIATDRVGVIDGVILETKVDLDIVVPHVAVASVLVS